MGLGAKIAKTLLIAFNFVFVLIGLAGIIVGALIRVKYTDYEALSTKDIGGVSILLIVLGGIIFIVAFFGCCGAMRENVVMLTIYIIFLVILLVIEVAGGIIAFVYKDNLKEYVRNGMENAMKNYDTSKYKEALDKVQKEFDCCGISGPFDYKNYSIATFPRSCCGSLPGNTTSGNTTFGNTTSTNTTCNPSTAYQEGCVDSLFDYLKDHMAVVGGLAIGVAVVQIIGVIFACVVRRDVKDGYNYV